MFLYCLMHRKSLIVNRMFPNNSLKEKIIIVADHDDMSAQKINTTLKSQGFSATRHANTGEKIYAILREFHQQPEKIGLIVINENLPHCQLEDMWRTLASTADAAAIPFVILCDTLSDRQEGQFSNDSWLTHHLASPFNSNELLLIVNFLLKLRLERLFHHAQKQQLILELSAKSVIEAKLKYLITHDELTGLFNRSNFERQLKLALNRCNQWQKNAALLFIEIDRFCLINESKGFDTGDRLLVELTILMRKLIPSKSLFARVGVNEFGLFLEDISKAQAKKYAENFKASVENFRFLFDEVQFNVTLSMGIAALDDVLLVKHPGNIVFCARQACHFAKLSGSDNIGIYNAEDSVFKERQSDIYWSPIIQRALRENKLFLVFQPVIHLNDGAISHYEVLLRMRSDDQVIMPSLFISVAERIGLIHAIDLWVIEHTIDFLAALPAERAYVSVAIKLSASAVHNPDLIQVIRDKLELTWVDASRLTFEITETAVIGHFDRTLSMVNKIRALGCKFALNNFGAGFGSFDYLKTFPVDYIKIDGLFVRYLVNDENDQMLLKSIVDRVAKLGKQTLVVYVELPNTVIQLREMGVNLAQGYTFGKPECELLEGAAIPFAQYMSERNRIEKALREKESYLRVLIDNVPFLVWLKDTQSRFLTVNQALAQKLGSNNPDAIVGKTDFDFYPSEKAQQHQLDDQIVLASRQRRTVEEDYIDGFGGHRWTEIFLAPVIDQSGEALGTLGFARDISERKHIEADLRIAATAFESQEGMIITDADTVILKINQSFTKITGYTAAEAIGRKMNLLRSGVQNAKFYADMWAQINATGGWQGEIWNRRKEGEIYPEWLTITAVKAVDGRITHYVGTMIDITARKAIEEQIHHLAHHDVLTDLPNRILLIDRLTQALAQARRDNTTLALMYIDLDKFKPVNDNFGHDVGDLLLKEVASRLLNCMQRESDTVSRLGGDEFVVLLSTIEKEQDAIIVAEKILSTLNQPFTIEQNLITISSSIGIAIYPTHGIDAIALMKNADNAMYQAKHAGRSCFKYYVDEKSSSDD